MSGFINWLTARRVGIGFAFAGLGSFLYALKVSAPSGLSGGLNSPFAHIGACLTGQYQDGTFLIAGHCPACWLALGFAVLALASPVRRAGLAAHR